MCIRDSFNDGIIVVLENGILTVNGTEENPVTFQGDRLEESFEDLPGQWAGILFSDMATGSVFRNATIRNSIVGARVDSLAELDLFNCQFLNQSSTALLGVHAGRVYAENSLFANSGGSSVSLQYGGDYEFNYCTMTSFAAGNSSLAASNFRCTEPTCLGLLLFNEIDLSFTNCIINGDQEDQIIFADGTEETGDFTYSFDHCVVQVDELLDNPSFATFFQFCEDCENVTISDTILLDPFAGMFSLDTMSLARDIGIPISGIERDILGVVRDASTPDVGCFELNF